MEEELAEDPAQPVDSQERSDLPDDVPAAEGEIFALRCVIPRDLQEIIGVVSQVVRVTSSVDRKQRRKHPQDITRYEHLTDELAKWQFVRKQATEEGSGSSLHRWQVAWYFEESGESWPMLAILELRHDGVLALRSVHRRQKTWGLEFGERSDSIERRGEK